MRSGEGYKRGGDSLGRSGEVFARDLIAVKPEVTSELRFIRSDMKWWSRVRGQPVASPHSATPISLLPSKISPCPLFHSPISATLNGPRTI